MNLKISPSKLSGTVEIPASKSYAHRALICAALADGESVVSGVTMSKDIEATIGAMQSLGADFKINSDSSISVSGIRVPAHTAEIDCNESGSTLRFIIPVAAALGTESEFFGRGRLPERPIDIYTRELSKNGVSFDYNNTMPFSISGKLKSGVFEVEGDVSSQFITGLLFALPLLDGDSVIKLASKLESKPYADITIDCLSRFGIEITENHNEYRIKGGQCYKPCNMRVEGDYSQAAFFCVANALGSEVRMDNLCESSVQGDREIVNIIENMRCGGKLKCFRADCSDIPDLVPVLTVLGCFGSETSVIYNAKRLKIKESNRLEAISVTLNKLGGNVKVTDDGLIIEPVNSFHGGEVDSFGDHRIVMSAAIAATKSEGDIIINGAEAVEKSYPDFFRDYTWLGGIANVITLE